MSTSSGRRGECSRCGHQMNEHASARDSKCKKCKKVLDICQTGYHGQGGEDPEGWRICYVPCNCGMRYYPDKANAARPLEPHEYRPSHPGYRPLERDTADSSAYYTNSDHTVIDATASYEEGPSTTQTMHTRHPSESSEDPITYIDTSTQIRGAPKTQERGQHIRYDSQSSEDPLAMGEHQCMSSLGDMLGRVDIGGTTLAPIASGPDPIFVETEAKHRTIRFWDLEGHKLKTQTNEWQKISTDEGSHLLYTHESGQQYWTWEFGSASQDQASGSTVNSKRRAGKGKEKQRKK